MQKEKAQVLYVLKDMIIRGKYTKIYIIYIDRHVEIHNV